MRMFTGWKRSGYEILAAAMLPDCRSLMWENISWYTEQSVSAKISPVMIVNLDGTQPLPIVPTVMN